MFRIRQSMMVPETGIAAILMQALRAMPAALDLHNTALTTAQDRHLPVPAATLVHPRIQAPRPVPVRLLDQVPPALPLTIPLLQIRTLHRTQAITYLPDQATVRPLHLRLRHLQRRRIQAEVVRRDK